MHKAGVSPSARQLKRGFVAGIRDVDLNTAEVQKHLHDFPATTKNSMVQHGVAILVEEGLLALTQALGSASLDCEERPRCRLIALAAGADELLHAHVALHLWLRWLSLHHLRLRRPLLHCRCGRLRLHGSPRLNSFWGVFSHLLLLRLPRRPDLLLFVVVIIQRNSSRRLGLHTSAQGLWNRRFPLKLCSVDLSSWSRGRGTRRATGRGARRCTGRGA
mmetsp:Transcript_29467/g.74035  ORF Transcript_29467/g.74035 Transcript_29467/m.74035 type:complete len:218 (+) Transcript_29467:1050-1703(+)